MFRIPLRVIFLPRPPDDARSALPIPALACVLRLRLRHQEYVQRNSAAERCFKPDFSENGTGSPLTPEPDGQPSVRFPCPARRAGRKLKLFLPSGQDIVLFDLAVHGAERDAEKGRRSADISLIAFQRLENKPSLESAPAPGKAPLEAGSGFPGRMQRRNADDVSIRKIDVKTNAVFQLTHIARPVVRCKIAERFWRERKFPAPGRGGKHAREMPGRAGSRHPPAPAEPECEAENH